MEESKDLPMKKDSGEADEPFIANNTEKVHDVAQSSISPDRTHGITDDTTKPTNDFSPENTKTGYFGIMQSRRLT